MGVRLSYTEMLTKNNCVQVLLNEVPDFATAWKRHMDWWEEEQAGLCNDMSAFARYLMSISQEGKTSELPHAFDVVEQFILDGDQDVIDAVATCVLENLLNYASHGLMLASDFVPLLGKASRQYCITWDEFTGTKTPGL